MSAKSASPKPRRARLRGSWGTPVIVETPDGERLVAIGDHEAVITLFDDLLNPLGDIAVGEKPMDGCFSNDKRTLLIANEGEGSLSVIDLAQLRVIATPQVGTGCEVLSYFTLK